MEKQNSNKNKLPKKSFLIRFFNTKLSVLKGGTLICEAFDGSIVETLEIYGKKNKGNIDFSFAFSKASGKQFDYSGAYTSITYQEFKSEIKKFKNMFLVPLKLDALTGNNHKFKLHHKKTKTYIIDNDPA